MTTNVDDATAEFNSYCRELSLRERVLVSLLRRGIADPDLGPSAKQILFLLADRIFREDAWTPQTIVSMAELAEVTGLSPERLGRGIAALQAGRYLETSAGCVHRLLPTRLVTDGEGGAA